MYLPFSIGWPLDYRKHYDPGCEPKTYFNNDYMQKLRHDVKAKPIEQAIDQKWAYMMYHGEAYHPLRYDLEAFIDRSQKPVSGSYKVKLYKGNIEITERHSDTALFSPEIRSIKSTGFNQQMCADAARVRGLPYQILAFKGRAGK